MKCNKTHPIRNNKRSFVISVSAHFIKIQLNITFNVNDLVQCVIQVLSGCGVYDGSEIHEASA